MKKKLLPILLLLLMISGQLFSQDELSGKWFISYQHQEEESSDRFLLKRAYITYKPQITPWLSGRITPDITIDGEGSDRGNIELRLKYLYAQARLPDFSFFRDNKLRVGVVPRPWIDYAQDINMYRAQGQMFLERTGVINSADYGVYAESAFGENIQTNGFKSASPGRYGGMVVGIYNGGGYSAFEENSNKSFEWRFTFRPFPAYLKGLLATYHGAWGEGNSIRNNRFRLNGVQVAYEHTYFVVSGEYYEGFGSYDDLIISERTFRSVPHSGYSGFAEFREPKTGLGAWVRYDSQQLDYSEPENSFNENRLIISAVWRFHKENKIILSYDKFYEGYANLPSTIWEATLDLRF